jgi:hypothetical protein
MVIFHSYVSLPEGILNLHPKKQLDWLTKSNPNLLPLGILFGLGGSPEQQGDVFAKKLVG